MLSPSDVEKTCADQLPSRVAGPGYSAPIRANSVRRTDASSLVSGTQRGFGSSDDAVAGSPMAGSDFVNGQSIESSSGLTSPGMGPVVTAKRRNAADA